MNNKEDLQRLLDYYLFSDLDDEAELNNYLSDAEIDYENLEHQLTEKLRQKRAELLLQKGQEFKEKYIRLKDEEYIENSGRNLIPNDETNFALAYRKKADEAEETEDAEAKKLDLIRKAKEEG